MIVITGMGIIGALGMVALVATAPGTISGFSGSRSRQRPGSRLSLLLTLFCLVPAFGNTYAATRSQPSEYELKAAFLFQFINYVDWPEGTFENEESPFTFGITGPDELLDALNEIAETRTVGQREIEVRRLRRRDALEDVNILFVDEDSGWSGTAMLNRAASASILTVTESGPPRPDTSVINFQLVEDRVRFDVSLPAAREGGLAVSSRLLQIALRVYE